MNQPKIQVVVSPGERAFGEITLDNPTAEIKIMRLYLEDRYYLPENSIPTSACPWITFSLVDVMVPACAKIDSSFWYMLPSLVMICNIFLLYRWR